MERGLLMLVFVLGLRGVAVVAQQSSSSSAAAAFRDCYTGCFIFCVITPQNTVFFCSLKCLQDCIKPPTAASVANYNTRFFCKIGCASTLCTNISTTGNPAAPKVQACVNSCSNTCY